MANIEGPGAWHFHIVGAMPPGVDPALMEANILTSVSMVMNLSAWVRGFWVEMSSDTPEMIRDKAAKLRSGLHLKQ